MKNKNKSIEELEILLEKAHEKMLKDMQEEMEIKKSQLKERIKKEILNKKNNS